MSGEINPSPFCAVKSNLIRRNQEIIWGVSLIISKIASNVHWGFPPNGKKIKQTQEEEVVRLLTKQGFREVTAEELRTEPYLSLAKRPECFTAKMDSKHSLLGT